MPIKKNTTNVEDNYVYTTEVNEVNIGNSMYYQKEIRIPTTRVTLNKTSLILQVGEEQTLTATVRPSDTTDILTWSQSNPNVTGLYNLSATSRFVKGLSSGTSDILATSGSCNAMAHVTVIPAVIALSFTNTTDSTVTLYQTMSNISLSSATKISSTWGMNSSSFEYSTDGSSWTTKFVSNYFTLSNGVYTCTGPATILTIPAGGTVFIRNFDATPLAASGMYRSPRGNVTYYAGASYKTIYADGNVYAKGKMSYFVKNSKYVRATSANFGSYITKDMTYDVTTTTRSITLDGKNVNLTGVI